MPLTLAAPARIAHRGMPRRARENTLASFALALQAGADGIELDVHATADGVVVVHHDAVLASGVSISSSPYADLGELPGTRASLPTLESVCALVQGRAELFVEIKGAGIEAAVLAALHRYAGALAIHSFDHALIHRMSRVENHPRLGILFEESAGDAAGALLRFGATDLWPHFSLVTPTLVNEVHAVGGRVIAWTVNEPEIARRLALLGVDGLCTDDVTMLPV